MSQRMSWNYHLYVKESSNYHMDLSKQPPHKKNTQYYYWLVVYLSLWKICSSVGMMTFPTEWKNNPNVPNHQPAMDSPTRISHNWENIEIFSKSRTTRSRGCDGMSTHLRAPALAHLNNSRLRCHWSWKHGPTLEDNSSGYLTVCHGKMNHS